jgi:hypothetical protein
MNTGPLAARALIAPRRHARAGLPCLETVDCRNDLSDQPKACGPRPYSIPVLVKLFSRNDESSDNVHFPTSDDTIAEGRRRSINADSACEIW